MGHLALIMFYCLTRALDFVKVFRRLKFFILKVQLLKVFKILAKDCSNEGRESGASCFNVLICISQCRPIPDNHLLKRIFSLFLTFILVCPSQNIFTNTAMTMLVIILKKITFLFSIPSYKHKCNQ